jgi:hypothetical protein
MFVSEVKESYRYVINNIDVNMITESNNVFASIMARHINEPNEELYGNLVYEYGLLAQRNSIAKFNHERLYLYQVSDKEHESSVLGEECLVLNQTGRNQGAGFPTGYFERVRNLQLVHPCLTGFGISNREAFSYAGRIRVINTHEHQHRPEEYGQYKFRFYHLITASYLASDISSAGTNGYDWQLMDSLSLEKLWDVYGKALDCVPYNKFFWGGDCGLIGESAGSLEFARDVVPEVLASRGKKAY